MIFSRRMKRLLPKIGPGKIPRKPSQRKRTYENQSSNPNAFRKYLAQEKLGRAWEQLAVLQSQRDCVLQPRVASSELPWVPARMDCNPNGAPTGLSHGPATEPQPRRGCLLSNTLPRVARSSQPWALSRNPFGIHLWTTNSTRLGRTNFTKPRRRSTKG